MPRFIERGHCLVSPFQGSRISGGSVPRAPLRFALGCHIPAFQACTRACLFLIPPSRRLGNVQYEFPSPRRLPSAQATRTPQRGTQFSLFLCAALFRNRRGGAKGKDGWVTALQNNLRSTRRSGHIVGIWKRCCARNFTAIAASRATVLGKPFPNWGEFTPIFWPGGV